MISKKLHGWVRMATLDPPSVMVAPAVRVALTHLHAVQVMDPSSLQQHGIVHGDALRVTSYCASSLAALAGLTPASCLWTLTVSVHVDTHCCLLHTISTVLCVAREQMHEGMSLHKGAKRSSGTAYFDKGTKDRRKLNMNNAETMSVAVVASCSGLAGAGVYGTHTYPTHLNSDLPWPDGVTAG